MSDNISSDSLVGLDEFEYIHIIFVFHLNTNGKAMRAHRVNENDRRSYTFLSKVYKNSNWLNYFR